jgi:hypothetical protein
MKAVVPCFSQSEVIPVDQNERDEVLAEYGAMRAEVLQLNSQIITIFVGTLTLDISVLGWFFANDDLGAFYVLPTIGVFFLVLGSTVLTNRLRLAHRLGMFQKYFIEPRLPGITWATVYFRYREQLRLKKGVSTWGERLTESGFLLGVGLINLGILAFNGLRPYWTAKAVTVDSLQTLNFVAACTLIGIGWFLRRQFRDYSVTDQTMRQISEERGLTG